MPRLEQRRDVFPVSWWTKFWLAFDLELLDAGARVRARERGEGRAARLIEAEPRRPESTSGVSRATPPADRRTRSSGAPTFLRHGRAWPPDPAHARVGRAEVSHASARERALESGLASSTPRRLRPVAGRRLSGEAREADQRRRGARLRISASFAMKRFTSTVISSAKPRRNVQLRARPVSFAHSSSCARRARLPLPQGDPSLAGKPPRSSSHWTMIRLARKSPAASIASASTRRCSVTGARPFQDHPVQSRRSSEACAAAGPSKRGGR